MNDYVEKCREGRLSAYAALSRLDHDGNLPAMVWALRSASTDTSGFGAGFLTAIAEAAAAA